MPSAPSPTCPRCQYVLDAFDGDCPRCHGQGLPDQTLLSGIPGVEADAASSAAHASATSAGVSSVSPSFYERHLETNDSAVEYERAPAWVKWAALALAVVLVVAGSGGYRYWASTPQYSLLQAQNAFNAHDLPRFERYLAIDAGAQALAADLLRPNEARAGETSGGGSESRDAAGDAVRAAFLDGIRGGLQATLAKSLQMGARDLVLKGSDDAGPRESSLAPLWETTKASIEDKEFSYQGVGGVSVSGENCVVKLNFYSDQTNQLYPIKLRMRRHEGHWQITRWENANAFFERLGAAFHF